MSQDPFYKEHHLRMKMDEYHVEVPDFPRRSTTWGRFINFLASPARNPLDPLISTPKGLIILAIAPFSIVGIALIQLVILL
ncbi:hypothetical protein [Cytobacillus gottheilii]|uniref:hypothetical protein n=1 Tax=Cytobacillus gottheilii TaxID=859144 RepID=UPI0009BA4194|nr:hypothetical protein [Cytobacillus gottheilii]